MIADHPPPDSIGLADNEVMNARSAGLALLALAAAAAAASPERPRAFRPAGLGLAVELGRNPVGDEQRRLMAELRATGVSVFALSLAWPAGEPSQGQYRIDEVTRAARLLRQSGATVHLDLPLVVGRQREVPADLASVAFDDPTLSLRLGRLLDALEPALLDCSTLSLGYEAEVYFSDKPEELKAYRRLFDGAVAFLKKKAPDLLVGVTTVAPTESPAPVVAAMLHQHSPVLFYLYAPFDRDRLFFHRPPGAVDRDWKVLLEEARERPIAFPEVSYSSSAENGSSPEKQAEFVRRFRRLVASTDGRRLLFARYVTRRDPPAAPSEAAPSTPARRRAAFFANRGLETSAGKPKPAWTEWVKTR
jgi:hypothetical protein